MPPSKSQCTDQIVQQPLRDWLVSNGLKGKDAEMPSDLVTTTADRYRDAFQRIVGKSWENYIIPT